MVEQPRAERRQNVNAQFVALLVSPDLGVYERAFSDKRVDDDWRDVGVARPHGVEALLIAPAVRLLDLLTHPTQRLQRPYVWPVEIFQRQNEEEALILSLIHI